MNDPTEAIRRQRLGSRSTPSQESGRHWKASTDKCGTPRSFGETSKCLASLPRWLSFAATRTACEDHWSFNTSHGSTSTSNRSNGLSRSRHRSLKVSWL